MVHVKYKLYWASIIILIIVPFPSSSPRIQNQTLRFRESGAKLNLRRHNQWRLFNILPSIAVTGVALSGNLMVEFVEALAML